MGVQALIPEASIERLDMSIVLRPSRTRKIKSHPMPESPQIQSLTDELTAVHLDALGISHEIDPLLRPDADVDVDGQLFL
ncbi:hypothetical protein GCM10010841_29930 [Deinococcus aerophilus]|uniref:Uncharacterized protein n=1 Tax=Deinococcus aerophilus TaxID=522488 RepID=A0ABQ2GYH3_9DEIO|nr:hypothetical protein GCM10010841_29930 [Deinococcus aerophilus]